MGQKLTMVYWKGERFWLGKLLEHPEIMTQGETLEELEENLKDAFREMTMDEVPQDYKTKENAL
jgi:predicted RNase H-like HicB family nuclease